MAFVCVFVSFRFFALVGGYFVTVFLFYLASNFTQNLHRVKENCFSSRKNP